MKRNEVIIASLALAATLALFSTLGRASETAAGVTPAQALEKLMAGNARYVADKTYGVMHTDSKVRASLAKGQKPFAIVLTCSDSRVAPELLFDQGLGDIFVVRVAGNVADPIILGSIEYAAEHLGSPLVVVLGHERCGAVTAAVDAAGKGEPEGNIGAIIKEIAPAVEKARAEAADKPKEELVEKAIDENARLVLSELTGRSAELYEMVAAGKLKMYSAKYDLDDGKVTLTGEAKVEAKAAQPKAEVKAEMKAEAKDTSATVVKTTKKTVKKADVRAKAKRKAKTATTHRTATAKATPAQ